MSANQKGQQPHDEAAGGTADELEEHGQHHVVEVLTTVAVANRGEVEARRRVEPAVDLPDTVGPECEVARALELLACGKDAAGFHPSDSDLAVAEFFKEVRNACIRLENAQNRTLAAVKTNKFSLGIHTALLGFIATLLVLSLFPR